ncbi:MAG: hypothetical protein HQ402_01120 [Parcubacteria group bacterium]|nr:hypothetical protein [Parcubacteria group bacterium]
MPHISQNKLEKETYYQIQDQFINLIASTKNKNKLQSLMKGLLTYTEKIMIAKRLAIIIMLQEDITEYEICHALKISSSTVGRIADNLEKGLYKGVTDGYKNKKQKKEFWDFAEKIIQAGLPPQGKNRWKDVFKSIK